MTKYQKPKFDPKNNTFTDSIGQVLGKIHTKTDDCDKYGCLIHNPTVHKMSEWPLIYRERGGRAFPERICAHGVGHPDPDDMNWFARTHTAKATYYEGIHGCHEGEDGVSCCYDPEVERHQMIRQNIKVSVDNGLI